MKIYPQKCDNYVKVHIFNLKLLLRNYFFTTRIKLCRMGEKNPKTLQCDIYACPFFGVEISGWCDQREEKYYISSLFHLTLQRKNWHSQSIALTFCSVWVMSKKNPKCHTTTFSNIWNGIVAVWLESNF